jgi:hypothetical protein
MKNVNLTYSFTEFEKINAPIYNSRHIGLMEYPSFLQFNKTYYRFDIDKLTAFRVLAIAFECSGFNDYTYYLVQLPNQKPTWVRSFITKSSIVFANQNDMFEYIGGNYDLNLNLKLWFHAKTFFERFENFVHNDNLQAEWTWSKTKNMPIKQTSRVKHVVITEDSVNISIDLPNDAFATREECVKNQLNGFIIEDFAEDPIEIEITILPNKPKIHTLRFIED